jgi:hypothetical protein
MKVIALLNVFLLFTLLYSSTTYTQKTASKLWCIKESGPLSFEGYNVLQSVLSYNQAHCSILCSSTDMCDMYSYYYNYTCSMYGKGTVTNAVFKNNPDILGSCVMNNISSIAVLIGKSNARFLNLTGNALCLNNYNTRGTNIQAVPPEPPFSPPSLSVCWEECENRPTCSHTIFQPQYKTLNLTACWMKKEYGIGINGFTGADTLSQATCFTSEQEFLALGYDESTDFLYIPKEDKSMAQHQYIIEYIYFIVINILYFVCCSLYCML